MPPGDLLGLLIIAHLVGDFLLQDDAMARNKSRSHWVCLQHVCIYIVPFAALDLVFDRGLPAGGTMLIAAQHYVQDRWALHLKWMRFWGQTPPERWPVGPLCVDQTLHLAWIALVAMVL